MEQKVKRIALSVFLVTVVLVSVYGVAEAEANLRSSDGGRSVPSLSAAPSSSVGYGSHRNGGAS